MILTLLRGERSDDALPGTLLAEGAFQAYTLENADKAITAGRYPVVLTESGRAKGGSLWSPRDDDKLPLLCDVAGRSGIRIHAANFAHQLAGCIAPGLARDEETDSLSQSRAALIKIMAQIEAAIRLGEEVWIDVVEAA